MKLTNPTDDQLDAAFAEKVAQMRPMWHVFKRGLYYRPKAMGYTSQLLDAGEFTEEEARQHEYPHDEPVTIRRIPTPKFTHSFDAVLPWLEKWRTIAIDWDRGTMLWSVGVGQHKNTPAYNSSLARAACIALLRANGVEVEFTK